MSTTFEMFFNYFLSTRPNATVSDASAAWDIVSDYEDFQQRYALSPEVSAFLANGKKVQAIKQHRKEEMDAGRDYSLKSSLDVINDAIQNNPNLKNAFSSKPVPEQHWVPARYSENNEEIESGRWINGPLANWEKEVLGIL